jgi:hypothetical protein
MDETTAESSPADGSMRCPHCRSTDFEVCGLVFYRQLYDGLRKEYGFSDVHWECDYPEYVECRGCHEDVTEYAMRHGVVEAVYDVVERDPHAAREE